MGGMEVRLEVADTDLEALLEEMEVHWVAARVHQMPKEALQQQQHPEALLEEMELHWAAANLHPMPEEAPHMMEHKPTQRLPRANILTRSCMVLHIVHMQRRSPVASHLHAVP